MRREVLISCAVFVIAGTVAGDRWLPGGPYLSTQQALAVSTICLLALMAAALSAQAVVREDLEAQPEPGPIARAIGVGREWTVIRSLPVWALIVLAVAMTVATAGFVGGMLSLTSDEEQVSARLFWTFAALVAGYAAYTAALAYGLHREGRTGRLARIRSLLRR
jgi:hypothetical protein